MNKFSDAAGVMKENRYANGEVLRNKIYDLIGEKLTVSVDGQPDEHVKLNGKEELVEAVLSFISRKSLKSRMDYLETVTKNNSL